MTDSLSAQEPPIPIQASKRITAARRATSLSAAAPRALGTRREASASVLETLDSLNVRNVLDCAAGQGAFARQMLQAGYEVSCCDLLPEQFQLAEISCEHADLNDRIPFDDESFDALTCLNGLQRVWARGRAFSEMARVTKPGGYLILTMFNNNNLMRRAMFLLTGSIIYDTVGPPQAFTPDAPEPAGCFRYPLTIADTLAGISSVGLELLSLKGVLWSKGSLLLAPLALIPLLLHPLAPKRYRDRCHLRQASSLDVLFKDCVVVVGQKPMPQLQR